MIASHRPRLLFAAALLALIGGCQSASTLEGTGPTVLSIRGKISSETGDRLERQIPTGAGGGRAVLYLASGGGDFETALRIAHRLEAMPHSTAVVTRECDSACVVIFIAARERLVDRDAILAVHRPLCVQEGLAGLPCRLFWEPWARSEFHARIARVSPRWADFLDRQDPPAFERAGADFVRVTGDQLIAFGAAAPLEPGTRHTALARE
jgi:hypothetical protein